ncbi:MAG: hypothetical protein BWY82_00619 [Verrucomicrobia bacterium ADurb.Bin474]|nr:MAG: hypothetical protein BWY82_00619 [Verrucomicrobia bacterium ADurb.Bin474]
MDNRRDHLSRLRLPILPKDLGHIFADCLCQTCGGYTHQARVVSGTHIIEPSLQVTPASKNGILLAETRRSDVHRLAEMGYQVATNVSRATL